MFSIELPIPESSFEEKVVSDVREFGWHCVLVARGAHPEHAELEAAFNADPVYASSFAYTVGVWITFGQPDLILVGPWEHQQAILNTAVGLVAEGMRFGAGDTSDEILGNYEVRFDAVSDSQRRRYLTYADWVNGHRGANALQLVLPDSSGRWPDEGAYDAYDQPLLGSA